MLFRLSVSGFALLILLSHTNTALADTHPPLDLIELLGEMGDEDNMLEIALAELEQKRPTQPSHGNKQNHSQDSDKAAPAGGSKK
ncbi:MAG: hypothetical protein Q8N02_04215 [Methylotenera sp.]|nr:hypothetical protein [Methylotenera sp.]MDP2101064.1 hypothetical protein [Methylotenera sp.]MDP2281853.1 hypothetical protein [Methylotenera sp.]MDP2403725.1 hypothetical protein [Methylotenera sp.]MDP3059932.1 hypothetical protein [Methylotenera sp.]